MPTPSRGDVWLVDLNPTRGHEQAGRRPALVVSVDGFNAGPAGLLIVVPITSAAKGVRSHVRVNPPEGGLQATSYAKCEDVRSISKDRLIDHWGAVSDATMAGVEERLRFLMGL